MPFDESVLSDVEKENIDTLSYWMQPELTGSNPTVIDKYDYGVDATAEEEQEDTSSGIYGTYADGNGNTIQITESYGTNPRGIDYIAVVDIFSSEGQNSTVYMTELQGSYYQLVPGGTKVVALIYPGDGEFPWNIVMHRKQMGGTKNSESQMPSRRMVR